MSSVFYPILPFNCPWASWGSCRFCGIPFMEKVLVPELPKAKILRAQFDAFVNDPKNRHDILMRHKRIAIAPNGSIVPEVPKVLRDYALTFAKKHGIRFESELIATLIDPKKARLLYNRHYQVKFPKMSEAEREKMLEVVLQEIDRALNVEFPGKNVILNAGLEVANSDDLKKLHKYTTDLDDFIAYAEYLRARNIKIGANILVGAPMIERRVDKALETIRFAFEKMKADKILLITWVPVKHTLAKKLYDRGEIDVISATEAAAIYQATRNAYPQKEIEFNPMRSYVFHSQHPNFRNSKIDTEEKKEHARELMQLTAQEIFA